MGFLPFMNQGGQRVVRWHRLVLAWLAILAACALGAAGMSYALRGDVWDFALFGLALGVGWAAALTAQGFLLPGERLPPA
jgi:hypothetical protein